MPIEFDNIKFNKPNGGGRSQLNEKGKKLLSGGSINFDRLKFGQRRNRSPKSEKSARSKKTIFEKLQARGQAKQAAKEAAAYAEQQRQLDLQKRAEEESLRRIKEARENILREISQGGQPTGDPGMDTGLPDVLAQIAEEDPEKALNLAFDYRKALREENLIRFRKWENEKANASKKELAVVRLQEMLNEKPFRAWGVKVRKPDPSLPVWKKALQLGGDTSKGIASLIGHSVVAALGDGNARNNLELDGEKMVTFAPSGTYQRQNIPLERLQEYRFGTDTPKIFDRILGFFGNFLDRDAIERLIPIGKITVQDRRDGTELTSVPVLFPYRKQQYLEITTRDILRHEPVMPPAIIQVPSLGYILKQTAEAFNDQQGNQE